MEILRKKKIILYIVFPNNESGKKNTSLMTAAENGEGVLDKEPINHNDVLDVSRMSLSFA